MSWHLAAGLGADDLSIKTNAPPRTEPSCFLARLFA